MKKRIFAILLAMSVMLSMAMFVSCNGEEDEEEEEIEINVTVRVVANDGNVLVDDLVVKLTDVPSRLTAFAATTRALDVMELYYAHDDGFITCIGDYQTKVSVANEEDEEDEDEDESEDTVDYFWEFSYNGRIGDSGSRATYVNDGDRVEWNFVVFD